jgi:hypothetical protein
MQTPSSAHTHSTASSSSSSAVSAPGSTSLSVLDSRKQPQTQTQSHPQIHGQSSQLSSMSWGQRLAQEREDREDDFNTPHFVDDESSDVSGLDQDQSAYYPHRTNLSQSTASASAIGVGAGAGINAAGARLNFYNESSSASLSHHVGDARRRQYEEEVLSEHSSDSIVYMPSGAVSGLIRPAVATSVAVPAVINNNNNNIVRISLDFSEDDDHNDSHRFDDDGDDGDEGDVTSSVSNSIDLGEFPRIYDSNHSSNNTSGGVRVNRSNQVGGVASSRNVASSLELGDDDWDSILSQSRK